LYADHSGRTVWGMNYLHPLEAWMSVFVNFVCVLFCV
jgi:hypothetical protein